MSRRIRHFTKWMQESGIKIHPSLTLFPESGSGFGVKSSSMLHEGEIIARIPKSSCLTCKTSTISNILEETRLSGHLGLAVAIMYERSISEKSLWFSYFQMLPECESSVPFLWDQSDVDRFLMGTELHEVVTSDKRLMKADWRAHIWPLSKIYPETISSDHFSLHDYLAARSLISSRAFSIDESHGFGLVPLADMFNHKTAAEDVHFTAIDPDSDSDSDQADESEDGEESDDFSAAATHSDEEEDELEDCATGAGDISWLSGEESHPEILEMIMVRDVSAGQEVYNTYGELSNAALLHRYGFTETGNPFDIVNLDLKLVKISIAKRYHDPDRRLRSCVRLLRDAGLPPLGPPDRPYFEIDASGSPQIELIFLFRLLNLSDADFNRTVNFVASNGSIGIDGKKLASECLGYKSGSVKRRSTKEPNGLDAFKISLLDSHSCELLMDALDQRDGLYPTNSLWEDYESLHNVLENSQEKQSISLRISERTIIQRCKSIISNRMESLSI